MSLFNWKEYQVELKRSLRKSIAIKIKSPGALEVAGPFFLTQAQALHFLEQKAHWIHAKTQAPPDPEREIYHAQLEKDHRKLKAYAQAVLPEALQALEKQTGLYAKGLHIRQQKKQWGSCDSKGVLRLNFRLAFLPKVLQNYIIIHELAHLVEMNHSPKFWALVATHCPDYKTHRARLKHYRI